jgi:hypothetical protein
MSDDETGSPYMSLSIINLQAVDHLIHTQGTNPEIHTYIVKVIWDSGCSLEQ